MKILQENVETGQRLKLFRESLDLNPSQFAKKLKVSHTMVNKYETGKNRLSLAKLKILATIGCDMQWFLTGVKGSIDKIVDNSNKTNMNNEDVGTVSSKRETLLYGELERARGEANAYKEMFEKSTIRHTEELMDYFCKLNITLENMSQILLRSNNTNQIQTMHHEKAPDASETTKAPDEVLQKTANVSGAP